MLRQWKETTRGGHHVKDVYRDPMANGRFVYHGKVCLNMGKTPPSDDPRDWQGECWDENGKYYLHLGESDLDLMEVQDGE
jgi:hypothetical protein